MPGPADWQKAQMCFRAGQHLPKRVRKMTDKWIEPFVTNYPGRAGMHGPYKQTGYSFSSYSSLFDAVKPYGKWHGRLTLKGSCPGNLESEEYRFYIGHPVRGSSFSQCRVCLKVCESREERNEHQRTRGCCPLFINAVKRIKMYGVCVVCNSMTGHDKWGVPLCNPVETICKKLWMFEVCQPLPLRQALGEVVTRAKQCIESAKKR